MLRERMAQRMAAMDRDAPRAPAPTTITYGNDPAQVMDVWPQPGATAPVPLVLFVHGGGWQQGNKDNATGNWKPTHYLGQGYAFASINYRLVPQARVEDQAADVAAALARIIAQADTLKIDRRRIVLMGHSAGAHLVALVGTDERYLKAAGLRFADVAGVIPVDGAAYDVPLQMRDGPQMMQKVYAQAFGDDPARQAALSPTLQAAAPNAARFLIPHVQRPDGIAQSEALAKALRTAGSQVDLASIPGEGLTGHMEINRRMGDPAYAATPIVDGWLKQVFGQ
ncbi:alpha/beta fold hydrolase [Novosphingobium sp. FSY-8]|uniref:Alpha/beta fold hydrolase n=1 Tax=Novosphingobium ovatum TaxID=1908523 RepID=A0ABW9XG35_9SPHN|nr:alpha/beta hydrolase [Novosphingobium ovatum]NBC37444.1 alpha/beta fold hydrolase [Novosphingobium ovatum]